MLSSCRLKRGDRERFCGLKSAIVPLPGAPRTDGGLGGAGFCSPKKDRPVVDNKDAAVG